MSYGQPKKRKFTKNLLVTILVSLLVTTVILEAGAALIGYREFTTSISEQYRDNVRTVTDTVTSLVDGDTIGFYLQTGIKDQRYETVERQLKKLTESTDCLVIYVCTVDPEGLNRTYIYDVVSEASGFTPYEIGYSEPVEESYVPAFKAAAAGEDVSDEIMHNNNQMAGDFATAIAPLKNSYGNTVAVVAAVKSLQNLRAATSNYMQQIFVFALMVATNIGFCWIAFMHQEIVKPIRTIVDETKRFTREWGELGAPLAMVIHSNDEMNTLAAAVDSMERQIRDDITQIVKVSKEKNRVKTELGVAAKIQRDALPKVTPEFPNDPRFDIYASMDPAKGVGGDFYDFFYVDDDHFAMVMADVSGKGIPGALFMMVSKMLLKNRCMYGGTPGEILADVNDQLSENNEAEMFVTTWLGILELSTGKVAAANAGHEYPVIGKAGGNYELLKDKHGFVLGGMEGMVYKSYEFSLEKGDTLFLYTDGVPEANDINEELYGTDRMLEALNRNPDKAPEELLKNLREEVRVFVGEAEQFDDLTMLALRYDGPEERNAAEVEAEAGTEAEAPAAESEAEGVTGSETGTEA
ncbi:MAG: SpoIIE family protein phosphatase [Clostridia bacterium]|nr:SpoIIE family protein phosphatase [Clostridia bacterium]